MTLEGILGSVREVRAALVSGWLWLVWLWVAAPAAIPSRGDGAAFQRLYGIGDTLGAGGAAVVGSIAAYVVGSALLEAQASVGTRIARRANRGQHERLVPGTTVPLADLMDLATRKDVTLEPPRNHMWWQRRRFGRVAQDRLEGKARDLITIATASDEQALRETLCRVGHTSVTMVARRVDHMHVRRGDGPVLMLPVMPTAARLLEDAELIRSRLLESAPKTADRIERLYGEADLRLSVAPPIFALGVSACVSAPLNSAVFYACLAATLAIPAGIGLQGLALRVKARQQLVDALRTRRSSVQLESLTPIFARYCDRAQRASASLEQLQ
jgi:hypothetical protein